MLIDVYNFYVFLLPLPTRNGQNVFAEINQETLRQQKHYIGQRICSIFQLYTMHVCIKCSNFLALKKNVAVEPNTQGISGCFFFFRYGFMCLFVCVSVQERERDRERDRQTDR